MHELVNHKGNFTLLTLKQNENNPCIYNNLSTEVDMHLGLSHSRACQLFYIMKEII